MYLSGTYEHKARNVPPVTKRKQPSRQSRLALCNPFQNARLTSQHETCDGTDRNNNTAKDGHL